ncbi:MAG: hypothetical protein GWP08_04620 [Nitrospiraceae bacterium]|nr:hypothetical protein [Nitrospiraceae bacterium]
MHIADRWRLDYNHRRSHSLLSWLTPAEFAARCRGRDSCLEPVAAVDEDRMVTADDSSLADSFTPVAEKLEVDHAR